MPRTTVEVDLRGNAVTVHASTGETTRIPLRPGMFGGATNIERYAWSSDVDELLIGLPGGREAIVELGGPGRSIDELRAGRPVIYLDQNCWSTIAAARFGHRRVPPNEARAAERLIELVEDQKILLPASSGHLVESGPLFGDRRTALTSTVLQLSRGWQMRNPVHVRAEEILRGVQGHPPAATNVFGPHVEQLFSSSNTSAEALDPRRAAWTILTEVVASVLSLYDVVSDDEAIPDEGGVAKAKAETWTTGWADLASELHAAHESAEMVRRVTDANMIRDMGNELVSAASHIRVPVGEVITLLFAPHDPISQMPFLAQMRQVLFRRVRNKTQKWKANDLHDIMFLCCAAGYADIVVGERCTIGYLRQSNAPPSRARLARSLTAAVALLDEAHSVASA